MRSLSSNASSVSSVGTWGDNLARDHGRLGRAALRLPSMASGGDVPDDPDRAAIVARRRRFVTAALAGLATTGTATACPCLKIDSTTTDFSTSTTTATESTTDASTTTETSSTTEAADTTESGTTESSGTPGTTGAETTGTGTSGTG